MKRRSTEELDSAGGSKRTFRLFVLVAALGVGALVLGRKHSGPDAGALAADFSLPVVAPATSASEFHLASARGTPVLLEVFASWCGVCKRSAPTLGAAARAPRKREVHFLGVSVDQSPEEAKSAAAAWGIPYDVAFDDGHFAHQYDISLLPTFVLIDADGRIRHVSSGAPRASELESWLAEVGAERL